MSVMNPGNGPDIAVFYLARGADDEFHDKLRRFIDSYRKHDAGAAHQLFIIYKGFLSKSDLDQALILTKSVDHTPFFFPDDGLDIGAYYRACVRVPHRLVFFMNTSSILNGKDWLLKLRNNLDRPGVGLVGASGSYEGAVGGSLQFPNVHVRTNAFMMSRTDFLETQNGGRHIASKTEAYELEHGQKSITAQCMTKRRAVLVVGKNGRGYPPHLWPVSGTFRQGNQENLLVRDGQTETFSNASIPMKRQLFNLAWGDGKPVETLKIWDSAAQYIAFDGTNS